MAATAKPAPITLLIAALGGEGGGLLTDWIVAAAMAEGYPVQSTSIPGVAQRTGATTYYIEIFPLKTAELDGRIPALALYPSPGGIDLMVASEIVEAGRAMAGGFVSPERTTLIAATHRIYAIAEKSAMGEGAYDDGRILKAAPALARRPLLHDFAALARTRKTALNAVLLGAIAGSGELPLSTEAFAAAIRGRGVAVEANLRGMEAGLACVRGELALAADAAPGRDGLPAEAPDELMTRMRDSFPEPAHAMLGEGLRRLVDYQDARYAGAYLERMLTVFAADKSAGGGRRGYALTTETGRWLALWMSYEDVIRVADLKTRRARMAAVRAEAGAAPGEPVRITEFLKPGVEEVAALMPPVLGRFLLALADRFDARRKWHLSMRVRTDTVLGYLRLRLLARLRFWRRHSHRFAEEQALIGRWLAAVREAVGLNYELALEVAECANLRKGYGETLARGNENFLRIFDALIDPALAGRSPAKKPAQAVRDAREAALADPEGAALTRALSAAAAAPGDPARAAAE